MRAGLGGLVKERSIESETLGMGPGDEIFITIRGSHGEEVQLGGYLEECPGDQAKGKERASNEMTTWWSRYDLWFVGPPDTAAPRSRLPDQFTCLCPVRGLRVACSASPLTCPAI